MNLNCDVTSASTLARLLFYGDWGREPKIVQTFLDGSHSETIRVEGLSNPNGLAFQNGQLFVADSNFNNRTGGPHLMLYNVSRKQWQELKLSSSLTVSILANIHNHYTLMVSSFHSQI